MRTYKQICPELTVTLKRDQVHKAQLKNSRDSAAYFRQLWEGMDIYESFFVIYLNQAQNTIGWYKCSQGGIDGTIADIRLIFAKALQCLATGMILCHNHPSGNLKPSHADIQLTNKIKQAGDILQIRVIDHIILTEDDYFSFGDDGMMM